MYVLFLVVCSVCGVWWLPFYTWGTWSSGEMVRHMPASKILSKPSLWPRDTPYVNSAKTSHAGLTCVDFFIVLKALWKMLVMQHFATNTKYFPN